MEKIKVKRVPPGKKNLKRLSLGKKLISKGSPVDKINFFSVFPLSPRSLMVDPLLSSKNSQPMSISTLKQGDNALGRIYLFNCPSVTTLTSEETGNLLKFFGQTKITTSVCTLSVCR